MSRAFKFKFFVDPYVRILCFIYLVSNIIIAAARDLKKAFFHRNIIRCSFAFGFSWLIFTVNSEPESPSLYY